MQTMPVTGGLLIYTQVPLSQDTALMQGSMGAAPQVPEHKPFQVPPGERSYA